MINQKELGHLIRHIRNTHKMDQKTFAEKINTTVSALSNWENGRNYPKSQYIENISNIFDVPTSYLTNSTEERVKELVDQLEKESNIKPIYKNLYDIKFKLSLISEISKLIDSQFNKHGFYNDRDIVQLIDNMIYEKDISYKFEPFNEENALKFVDDRIYNCRSEIKTILSNKGLDNDFINEIDFLIYEVQSKIQLKINK